MESPEELAADQAAAIALLQVSQEPEADSDELQADSDEALFGSSDEGESDSALYGNALLQQEPQDGYDELQADSDEALFGKTPRGSENGRQTSWRIEAVGREVGGR